MRLTRSTIKTVRSSTSSPDSTEEVNEWPDQKRWTPRTLMSSTTSDAVMASTASAHDQARHPPGNASRRFSTVDPSPTLVGTLQEG